MENNLTTLEEFDIERKLKFPYLQYSKVSIISKVKIAYSISKKTNEELLLISDSGFGEPCILAGITTGQIEYFTKNSPLEYKKKLAECFLSENGFDEVVEIVEAMDAEIGNGRSENRERFEKVLKYIQDNFIVYS
jgi:hypothetical protein